MGQINLSSLHAISSFNLLQEKKEDDKEQAVSKMLNSFRICLTMEKIPIRVSEHLKLHDRLHEVYQKADLFTSLKKDSKAIIYSSSRFNFL